MKVFFYDPAWITDSWLIVYELTISTTKSSVNVVGECLHPGLEAKFWQHWLYIYISEWLLIKNVTKKFTICTRPGRFDTRLGDSGRVLIFIPVCLHLADQAGHTVLVCLISDKMLSSEQKSERPWKSSAIHLQLTETAYMNFPHYIITVCCMTFK